MRNSLVRIMTFRWVFYSPAVYVYMTESTTVISYWSRFILVHTSHTTLLTGLVLLALAHKAVVISAL